MNKTTKIIIGVVVLVIILVGGYYLLGKKYSVNQPIVSPTPTTTQQPAPEEPIKIGFIGPLTGDVASIGENIKTALEIAKDEINQTGINGRKIEIIYEDGKCDPKAAVDAANKLINIDKVKIIIGGICSSETLAVAPLAEQNKVILFSSASTNPKISEAGDYIFRNVPSDNYQGNFAAEFIKNNMKVNKVAILKCLSDWCLGVAEAFKNKFKELNGEVAAEESFKQDARDLRSQLTKIKASKPGLIYFVSYTEGTIVGIKQIKELGIKSKIFGADAWSDPKIWQELGTIGNGALYVEPANKALPQNFIDEMNKRTGGKEIVVYAPRAYDILKLLAQLITQNGYDSEKIKNALYQVKDYQGIADNYTFDQNGDIVSAKYIVKEIQNGKPVEVK
ncbi:MAG: ethanolamine utilization protein EutJ [Candidatus Parcubacteria bacterium]|nr:MAG: ethanolamine utilization protein EutJ [Candidatus Parcubacteria bacterium]